MSRPLTPEQQALAISIIDRLLAMPLDSGDACPSCGGRIERPDPQYPSTTITHHGEMCAIYQGGRFLDVVFDVIDPRSISNN